MVEYQNLFIIGKIIKNKKYKIDRTCLICINEVSISWAPAQVNKMKMLINIQNNIIGWTLTADLKIFKT